LAKDESAKVKAKADPATGGIHLLAATLFSWRDFAHPSDQVSLTRVAEVPVPPPRVLG